MTGNENVTPSGARTSDDDQKVSPKNDPFAKCFSKAFPNISIQPKTVKSAPVPQQAEQGSKVLSSCPQDIPFPPPDETERLLVAPDHVETVDQLNIDQDENKADGEDYDFNDSDMESSEDEDIPLEEDPFFGDPTAQAPGVTALQLEEIRKALEDAKEIDDEMPPLEDNDKTSPVDAIFSEQNTNPKTIVVNVGSSFSKWIYLILEPTEPLYEMKLKFIQAADLGFEELARLEFTFAGRVIGDEDTVEQLGIQQDSSIYCQLSELPDGRENTEHPDSELVADTTNRRSNTEAVVDPANRGGIFRLRRSSNDDSEPHDWSM
ncbi:hypothetical protein D6D01_01024 [Aureobasidium pullulans]|uniref:Ubiquitin-like domain-containing protein n=1 Tax=Aureobasidium pullulans TaxID=5580 RepID=A0A4S9M0H6_AURPU|nr:hypothetical protein D6D01_01024 [Aureobasidium pullulans]